MAVYEAKDPLGFFRALTAEFGVLLAQEAAAEDLASGLLRVAVANFEANVARQCEGHASLACHGGCAACCALRVTATAPEILAVAAHLRALSASAPPLGRILRARIAAAAATASPSDDAAYLALGRTCVFVIDGHCVIYDHRPLACRGHASFDEAACHRAIAGAEEDDVPLSEPHHLLRAYVQNALQSALRDAGRAWAIYEFVPALAQALECEPAEAWSMGEDPLAACRAADVSLAEMAATFDEIKALAG